VLIYTYCLVCGFANFELVCGDFAFGTLVSIGTSEARVLLQLLADPCCLA
jgi:hypothetical protein